MDHDDANIAYHVPQFLRLVFPFVHTGCTFNFRKSAGPANSIPHILPMYVIGSRRYNRSHGDFNDELRERARRMAKIRQTKSR